jgi:hypothetical protein
MFGPPPVPPAPRGAYGRVRKGALRLGPRRPRSAKTQHGARGIRSGLPRRSAPSPMTALALRSRHRRKNPAPRRYHWVMPAGVLTRVWVDGQGRLRWAHEMVAAGELEPYPPDDDAVAVYNAIDARRAATSAAPISTSGASEAAADKRAEHRAQREAERARGTLVVAGLWREHARAQAGALASEPGEPAAVDEAGARGEEGAVEDEEEGAVEDEGSAALGSEGQQLTAAWLRDLEQRAAALDAAHPALLEAGTSNDDDDDDEEEEDGRLFQ